MKVELEERPMVVIKNAWKAYKGEDYVLKNLSMLVPKGKIYSILGASGVGKTTLLKCITGSMALDAGKITVDISSKLQIGYMPQELGLYMELTIYETFHVFGKVLNMSRGKVLEKMNELMSLLELPKMEAQICNLSGGEQRRVSIAIAFLNNPDLVILDEPTASLDVLLKRSIWSYLERISRLEGKTVVLTTHYIEEAKHSDLVAFINNGSILLEGKPIEVIANTGSHSLEQVYYHLCHKQLTNKIDPQVPQGDPPLQRFYDDNRIYSNTRVLATLLKSFYYLKRNLLVFCVIILTPALLTMLVTETVRQPKQLPVGFVNMESNCTTQIMNCSTPLSCRYLDKLRQDDINMLRYQTATEGREAVERNKIWGLLKFNSNFSDGVINRLEYFYATEHVEISDEDEASVWLDMSMYPIAYMLKRTLYDSYLESIQDWYNDCGWNSRAAHPLFRLEETMYGNMEDSLYSTYSPGMAVMLVFSSASSLALILVLTEKEFGTFERCKIIGMTLWDLLMSEFLFCFITMIPGAASQLLTLYFYSGPTKAPVFLAILMIYLVEVTGILFGLLIALLTNNLSTALLVSVTLMNSFYYLAGVTWPLEGSHWSTRFINNLLPSTIPVASMVDMANKGSSITNYNVYIGFINSFIWIAILLASIIFVVRRNSKQ